MEFDRLERFLARVLPGSAGIVSCERLTGGASRETYRITAKVGSGATTFALRRALGEDEQPLLGRGPGLEAEPLLFRAALEAGVPGPAVVGVLEADDDLGVGFLMEWVDGETLGGRIARGAAFEGVRGSLARECGQALARIHGVDVDAAGLRTSLREAAPEKLIRETHQAYRALGEAQPMIDFAARWLLDNLPAARPLALTHGDFRNGNLMVSPDDGKTPGLCAVLDWELAHIGDPMRDLGWLCTRSWRFGGDGPVGGFGSYEDLFAGYEAVAGQPVDREAVRFWEVFGSFWWSIGCLGMARSFREDPESAGVERPVIGRRSSECQIDCVNLLIPGPARAPEENRGAPFDRGLPRVDELLAGVAGMLDDVASGAQGRERFLARVARNAIEIVERELRIGPAMAQREADRLAALLGSRADLGDMRRKLCDALWSGEMDLADEALRGVLRDRVLAQVMIDQPNYPGAVEALGALPKS